MAMPKAPPAATPLTGDEIVRLIQSGKLVLAKASSLQGVPGAPGASAYDIAKALGYAGTQAQWVASLKGDTGSPGAPLRVEAYTATSNASGVATYTWPAFTAVPMVLPRTGWTSDQYIGGGVATGPTLTGCTALVKRSRGSLLLSAGPFETAANTALTLVVIGR